MNRPTYTHIVFCFCLLAIGAGGVLAESQTARSGSEQGTMLDVGRDNPFAEIATQKKAPLPRVLPASQVGEGLPELFL